MTRTATDQLAIRTLEVYLGAKVAELIVDAFRENQEQLQLLVNYLSKFFTADKAGQLAGAIKEILANEAGQLRGFVLFVYENVRFQMRGTACDILMRIYNSDSGLSVVTVLNISLIAVWCLTRYLKEEITGQQFLLDYQRKALPLAGAYGGKVGGQWMAERAGSYVLDSYPIAKASVPIAGAICGCLFGAWFGQQAASKIDNWFAGSPQMAVTAAYQELNLPMDESNDKLIQMYKNLRAAKLDGKEEGVKKLDTAMAIIAVHRALPVQRWKNGDLERRNRL